MNHPEVCYVFIPTEKSVGIVKWGESGYYKTNYPHNFTYEVVAELNEKSGFSQDEIRAMQFCSMANLPDTEEAWTAHYKKCLGILKDRG